MRMSNPPFCLSSHGSRGSFRKVKSVVLTVSTTLDWTGVDFKKESRWKDGAFVDNSI